MHALKLALIFFTAFMTPQVAMAAELGLGLASVEEGDDRHRPAVVGHLGYSENTFSHVYYYGRKYGPVTERTIIVSANYKLDIFKQFDADFLFGHVGLCVMNEQTQIKFPGDSENSETENSGNLGFVVGMLADIPMPDPLFITFTWESHVFFAGEAGIFMANGRKQALSLVGGFRL